MTITSPAPAPDDVAIQRSFSSFLSLSSGKMSFDNETLATYKILPGQISGID